jgi:hypothetical protein
MISVIWLATADTARDGPFFLDKTMETIRRISGETIFAA